MRLLKLRPEKRMLGVLAFGMGGMFTANCALANIYYYNNVVSGDRAVGMGGAFTGISDDASGVIYNPAGLAFSINDSVSGSANAYYLKRSEYKNTIGSKSFVEKSNGYYPSFIGGAKKLDFLSEGLVGAFAIYFSDFEFKDQDDFINNPKLGIESFHRTVNKKASTLHIAFGVGKRIFSNFSLGMSLGVVLLDEVQQQYQDAVLETNITNLGLKLSSSASNKGKIYSVFTDNSRTRLSANGVEPAFGFQGVLFDKLSLGFMYRKTFYFSQKFESTGDRSRGYQFADFTVVQPSDLDKPDPSDQKTTAYYNNVGSGKINRQTPSGEYSKGVPLKVIIDEPFFEGPSEARGGLAYFATTRLLWSFDVSHHFEVDARKDLGIKRESVTNYMTGLEYYATPAMPVRMGFFTNNDTRPAIDSRRTDQADHIDYYGGSLYAAWAQPTSQIGAGVVGQYGRGKSQKVSGSLTVQDVNSYSVTLLFSATHNL